ncbi:MAG: UDP-N-acetylglucosamine 2-epimerase (hydrolyzing) [Nanoarchaeota archaeon]|nr:UDP-N-acetylglucosamine 2-epimerase (hydrolyzing) [Nanoarchaeota archaeon]
MKRKICVVTGTRAEYGILKPIMKAILEKDNLELMTVVTGMHLLKKFGYTVKEVEKDFEIDGKVKMIFGDDSSESTAIYLASGIKGFAKEFKRLKPDMVFVLGDRSEALAAAITAAYMNITLVHASGGDSARAGMDESNRHAITKFAHIHFPTTKKSLERIIKLGENPEHVFNVGSSSLDTIMNRELIPKKEICQKYGIDENEEIILLVQHPVSTQAEQSFSQMIETLEAIKELNKPTVLIYPNSDAGWESTFRAIKKYEKLPFIKTFKSLPHIDYLSIMAAANVMVGNSSSGIVEAFPFYLPVVNIGIRQEGRERAGNIIDAPHDKKKIKKAIEKALYDKGFKRAMEKSTNPYGDGKTGVKIAEILSKINVSPEILKKKISY